MADEQIVLVLGAGAGTPYDFPSGKELIHRICMQFPDALGKLEPRTDLKNERRREAATFARELSGARADSIDEFLWQRADLRDIGMKAIAAILLPLEEEAKLRSTDPGHKGLWYDDLWSWLHKTAAVRMGGKGKPEDLLTRPLSIVTFNYDRSLEYYLWDAVARFYGVGVGPAGMVVRRMRIAHVYGQLGNLPWDNDTKDAVPYGGGGDADLPQSVEIAAGCIDTLYEGTDERKDLMHAWDWLSRAAHVVFLGFGYHPMNLARLKLGEMLGQAPTLHGTVYYRVDKKADEEAAEEFHRRVVVRLAEAGLKGNPRVLANTDNQGFFARSSLFAY